MAIDFSRSWMNEELEMVRDTAIRFIENEMTPHDEQTRSRHGSLGRAKISDAPTGGATALSIFAFAYPRMTSLQSKNKRRRE